MKHLDRVKLTSTQFMKSARQVLSVVFFLGFSWATQTSAEPVLSAPTGGRMGLHGMVLIGNQFTSYFIEHIPMLSPPHDLQLVATVTLKQKDGSLIQNDFSKGMFTLLPSIDLNPLKFSLNDLLNYHLKIPGFELNTFPAAIYSGDFEHPSGRLMSQFRSVLIHIQKIELARPLPAEASVQSFPTAGFFTRIKLLPNETISRSPLPHRAESCGV